MGITGVPSDTAILNTVMKDAGGNPDDADVVTIGFNGVRRWESGKVAAFTGFIPADGVQVETDGYPTKSFLLDEYGGPSHPGLVVFSTESKIGDDPDLMQGFVDATIKGYQDALADPARGDRRADLADPGHRQTAGTKSFEAWTPLLGPADTFGQFNKKNLESLSTFMVDNDLASEPISPDRYATTDFTQPKE